MFNFIRKYPACSQVLPAACESSRCSTPSPALLFSLDSKCKSVFLLTYDLEHVINCLLTVFVSSFVKCPSHLLPIFLLVCLFIIYCILIVLYSAYKFFLRCMYGRCFLLICGLIFNFLNGIFQRMEILNFFKVLDHYYSLESKGLSIFLNSPVLFVEFHT